MNSPEQVQATSRPVDRDVSTLLHRIDPPKNEARFYLVMVGSSLLFDPHAVMRVWGRIGGHQRAMITPCPTEAEARKLANRLIRRRLKRGYKLMQGDVQEEM